MSYREQHRVAHGGAIRNVLIVTRAFDYGGAEKHLLELLRRIDRTGLRLSILCLGQDLYSERLGSGRDIEVTACTRPPNSLWDWVRLFRKGHPDVVVFIYGWIWAFPWFASIGARLAGIPRRFSIQHLMTPIDTNRGWARELIRRMFGPVTMKISASQFHTTIAVSDNLKKSLIRDLGFPAGTIRTIHNGISSSEFAPSEKNGSNLRNERGISSGEFVLACAARLSEQKGIDILLQGLALVMRAGIPFRCFVIGDGPLKDQLIDQARRLGLTDRVFFEGFREDVRMYLQASSAFVLPSRREGLPLSILEAMACGLPCIVTDVGGNSEAIKDKINGLVVPAGSAEALANAISYLATHEAERAQMCKVARKMATEEFDIEKSMAEIARVVLN